MVILASPPGQREYNHLDGHVFPSQTTFSSKTLLLFQGSLDTTGTINEEATIFSKDSLRFICIMHSIDSKLTITQWNKGEVSKGPRDGGSPQTGDHQALSYCCVSQVRSDGVFYSKTG